MDKNQNQFSIWYVFIALWAMMLFQLFVTPYFNPIEIPYSEFKAAVAAGKVDEVSISSIVIHGKMKPESSPHSATPSEKAAEQSRPSSDKPYEPLSSMESKPSEGLIFNTVRVEDPDLIRDLENALGG